MDLKKLAHTPGPWTVHPSISDSVTTAKGGAVADCVGPDKATRQANARLIAKTPDLLLIVERLAKLPQTVEALQDLQSEAIDLLNKISGVE